MARRRRRNYHNKANIAQPAIAMNEPEANAGSSFSSVQAYTNLEIVRRGVDLLVDSCASVSLDVIEPFKQGYEIATKKPNLKKVYALLNQVPNLHLSTSEFWRNVYMDIVMEGNAYAYYDQVYIYNVPADGVTLKKSPTSFIEYYKYAENYFKPNELMHFRDNSATSIYLGSSRLKTAAKSIRVLTSMKDYQENIFKNSAVASLVLMSKNPLSQRFKDKTIEYWMQNYSAKLGGKKPLIIDGDFTLEKLNNSDFQELEFLESVEAHEKSILRSLGVPYEMATGTASADTLRQFYNETVLPLVNKVISTLERFFGYDIKPAYQHIRALQPDLRDLSSYLVSLTNAGIITRNESRDDIRLPRSDDPIADRLFLPQNIAGSAMQPAVGGRPEGTTTVDPIPNDGEDTNV